MVKLITKFCFILFLLLIVSCLSTFTKKNSAGNMRFGINRFSINAYNLYPLSFIDTNAIYVNYASFYLNDSKKFSSGFSYFRKDEENNNFNYKGYIRFFSNGKVALYSISKDKKLKISMFNPNEAKMGVYGFKKEDFLTEFLIRGDGGGTILKSKLIYQNQDTLYFLSKVGSIGSIYVKLKDSDTLAKGWKPDW